MNHEILFQNPIFDVGLNVTCRFGTKWTKASLGDTLILREIDKDSIICESEVVGNICLNFDDIPESLLKYEHDPDCRDKDGLLAELKRIYGDVTGDSKITVLVFKVEE